ncbi:MAG: ArnT family glycosyltransferase [Alphaproteobacteria bacterium]
MTVKRSTETARAKTGEALVITLAFWAIATAVSIGLRPVLPVDETRYLSVAWEMWWRSDFLVPYLNGEPYPDKPPLVFWLIHLAWWLTGVNETAARLVSVLFGVGSTGLAVWLTRLLWPERPEIAALSPIILVSLPFFMLFGTLVMFDVPLTFFVLLGLVAVVKTARGGARWWWCLFALAAGGGILTKGPIALLHLLPAPLLAPLWWPRERPTSWRPWYGLVALASLAGAALALAWALPAAAAGGEDYAYAILWRQTAGRMVVSFAHARPWWFYPALLPVMLYPWGWTPALWRGLSARRFRETGLAFCLAWGVPPFLVLMAISGKQPHYLLPLLPAFAIAAARLLSDTDIGRKASDLAVPAVMPIAMGLVVILGPSLSPALLDLFPEKRIPSWIADIPPQWGGALIAGSVLLSLAAGRTSWRAVLGTAAYTVIIFVTANAVGNAAVFRIYDLARISAYLGAHQDVPIAYNSHYTGEFGFLGRLKRPIVWVYDGKMKQWMKAHPGGRVILRYKETPSYVSSAPVLEQQYRGHRLGIWAVPEESE